MSSGLFSIGSSALTAAYAALQTTGNKIANANTPGYSRQIVDFSAQVETSLSGNYIGEGVAVASIHRAYDELLTRQGESAQANSKDRTCASLRKTVSHDRRRSFGSSRPFSGTLARSRPASMTPGCSCG